MPMGDLTIDMMCDLCGTREEIEPSPRYRDYSGRNPFYSENSIREDVEGAGWEEQEGDNVWFCADCADEAKREDDDDDED